MTGYLNLLIAHNTHQSLFQQVNGHMLQSLNILNAATYEVMISIWNGNNSSHCVLKTCKIEIQYPSENMSGFIYSLTKTMSSREFCQNSCMNWHVEVTDKLNILKPSKQFHYNVTETTEECCDRLFRGTIDN